MNLKELKEKKNELVSQEKSLLETAIEETRSLTAEEDEQLRSIKEDITKIENEIKMTEEEIRTQTVVVDNTQPKGEDKMTKTYEEIRSEFIEGLAIPNKELSQTEVRASGDGYVAGAGLPTGASTFTDANKGAMNIPLTIESAILKAIDFNSSVLSHANIIRTAGTHRLVLDVAPASKARLVKEGQSISTVDSEFRKVELNAFKYAEIVKFTREVVEDVNFNVIAHASERLGQSFAKAFEEAIIKGTGTGQPQGLLAYEADNSDLQKASENVTASATSISLADVTKAYYDLPHECRPNAIFLCHPSVVRALALIEDTNGRAILKPDYTGEFLTIFGKRIVECPYMEEMGTGSNKVAMFVDVKRALTVGLRTDVSVRQLHELYAVTDMVALVGVARLDSKIVQHGAISAIKLGS